MVRILGARRQVSFSAQWYLVFTEVRNYQDTVVKSVESASTIPIRMRVFTIEAFGKDLFFLSLPLYYIIIFLKNQIFFI